MVIFGMSYFNKVSYEEVLSRIRVVRYVFVVLDFSEWMKLIVFGTREGGICLGLLGKKSFNKICRNSFIKLRVYVKS